MSRASAVIDHDALRANAGRVRELAGSAAAMAVVKADAYGHGMVEVAATLRATGVPWLGVALPGEALALRAAGDSGRVLAWLWAPGDADVRTCVAQGVDLSVSSDWALAEVIEAARATGATARVHLKVDTGLARNGVAAADLPGIAAAMAEGVASGLLDVVGMWTHLADGEVPGAESAHRQRTAFDDAVALSRRAGLRPALLHVGNSGTLWAHPGLRYDLVRCGIAYYGLAPGAGLGAPADLGLVPAMTLRASLAHAKAVASGTAVSYGGTWTSTGSTRIGLVPLGYADGIPRQASGRVDVALGGRRFPQVGRVAMDQFVVDLGAADARAGDEVTVFGPGDSGEATADEWAERIGTIGYEIVTRVGARVPRVHRASAA